MEDRQLPPELQQLERHLTERPRPQPSADLRRRVIGGVCAELRQERSGARWTFAGALAAAVLVWVNLSLSVTQATDYGLRLGGQGQAIGGVAEQIGQVLPELLPQEALRQAILWQAASTLRPCPRLPAPPDARDRLDALDSLLSRDDLLSQGT